MAEASGPMSQAKGRWRNVLLRPLVLAVAAVDGGVWTHESMPAEPAAPRLRERESA